MPVRRLIRVAGTVQGVGFRPFVLRTATDLGLTGFVGNDTNGVVIEAQGEAAALDVLVRTIRDQPPPLAVVERVTSSAVPCAAEQAFVITTSAVAGTANTNITPDTATCADCLRELFDPDDRRYRYPFINCTNCGPRFTIVTAVPYDRPNTTMRDFAMCPACRREYDDPTDRRFHAQPVCCARCGPALALVTARGVLPCDDVASAAAELLRDGGILAIKGLGGYHLAALAADEEAVCALRSRKVREDKPFAVMCRDLAAASDLVDVDTNAARLLTAPERPIVLLPRRLVRADGVPRHAVATAVAPGNRSLGVMLPYTPLHHLLLAAVAEPIVLTSGNRSDEPIAFRDEDALERLGSIADAFVVHNRAIHVRTDDSVVRVQDGRVTPVRRSRGYVPSPIRLPVPARRPVLACGAELKSTVAVVRDDHAYLSHHLGDLEDAETFQSFLEAVGHLRRLLAVDPLVVAHDLHPDYLSTKWTRDLADDLDLVAVQHHHAHIASCLADNGERGPVIGVAYDGLGFGTDGTLWGGEIVAADLVGCMRLAHLEPVRMPGGAAAVRQPWRMAAAWLACAYGGSVPDVAVAARHGDRWRSILALTRGEHSPETSSVGRLFDAVAALCGIRDEVTYEGQAAIELEQAADVAESGGYPMRVEGALLRGTDLVRAVVADLAAGVGVAVVAARFHRGLAAATAAACAEARGATGLSTVALSGGVFQNQLLTAMLVTDLRAHGFRVLTHHRVPPNDGGISLGQAAVAAAQGHMLRITR